MAEPTRQLDNNVYDTGGTDPSKPLPDLKALEDRGQASQENTPSHSDLETSEDLAAKENAPQAHVGQLGNGYRQLGADGGLKGIRNSKKKTRLFLLGGGVGAVLISLIIALFGLFASTLKLPQLESHLGRRLARSARTFTDRVNTLNTDKVLADPSDPEVKPLLADSPLGKAMNLYDPRKAVRTMKASGSLDFEYDAKGKISSVIVDGNKIDAPDIKFGRLIQNRTEWNDFYKSLYTETNRALLRDGQSYLVRSRVSKAMIQAFGGKLYFWQKKGADEKGKTRAQAMEDAQLQLFEDVQESPTEGKAITDGARDTADKAVQDEKACLAKPACAQEVSSGQLSLLEASGASKRISDYADKLKGLADGPVGYLSTLYAVGGPVCMIYDGSIKTSKAVIDAQQSSALRAYLALASAADQQKKGDVTAAAVGGLNDLLGDISDTNPEKLAHNQPIDTSVEPYSQSTRVQNYTIFNAIFGPLSGAANTFANTFCPILLNQTLLYGVLGVSAATLLLPGVGKIIENGLEKFSTEGLRVAAQQTMKDVLEKALLRFTDPIQRKILKNSALKFGATNGAAAVGTDALTYAARMVVLAEMGAFVDGGDPGDLANQADMGAVVYNTELDRQQNFGRPLTITESRQAGLDDTNFLAAQDRQNNVFQRYFAVSNPDSLLSEQLINLSSLLNKPSKIITGLVNFPSVFVSSMKPVFSFASMRAAAAMTNANQNYNVIQWGWSDDETNLIKSDSSFDPLVNAKLLQDSGQSQAILDKYGVCFGVKDDGNGNPVFDDSASIGKLVSGDNNEDNRMIYLDGDGSVVPGQGLCSPQSLSYRNNEFGPMMVFRWRLNQSYMSAMNELTDMQSLYEGPVQ